MKDLTSTLQDSLRRELESQGYDLELIPIPSHGDRMLKLRTLEEVLDEFESDSAANSFKYVVQVKPKNPVQFETAREIAQSPKTSMEGIYLHDGKLNCAFLVRNAELLYSAGEYGLARNIYTSILQSGEKSGYALLWIGHCLEKEGKLQEALSAFEESAAYHPTFDAYQAHAALLSRLTRDEAAAEVLERALLLKDLKTQARFELQQAAGNAWLRAGKTEAAEKRYRLALEENPASDSIQSQLGALCLQTSRIAEARRHFLQAIAANDRCGRAYAGFGSCALAEDNKREAHDYFAKSLEIDLNNSSAIFNLVKCAYELKSYATAARLLGEYIQISPVSANLLYSLAGLQFHLGRLSEARATVNKILELQPTHSGAQELLKLIDRFAARS